MSSSRSPEVTAALAARFLLGVSFGSILAVGLTDGALGVAWPTMRDEFGRSLDDLGIVLGAFFVGFGPATALHRKLLPRFGMGRLVLAGPSLAVVGLLIVASAPGWLAVLAGYALVGLGNGLSDPSINLYLALHHGVRPMGLLHASFGLGTTLSPLIMTAALPVSWRLGYVVLIGVELVVVAAMVRARPRWLPVEGDGGRVSFPSSAVTWITLTIFMLYTGSELAAGQWAFSLLTESRDIGDTAAGFVVSVYWGGLTVGRLVYGTVGDRFPPRSMLSGAFIVAATGMAMVWDPPWSCSRLPTRPMLAPSWKVTRSSAAACSVQSCTPTASPSGAIPRSDSAAPRHGGVEQRGEQDRPNQQARDHFEARPLGDDAHDPRNGHSTEGGCRELEPHDLAGHVSSDPLRRQQHQQRKDACHPETGHHEPEDGGHERVGRPHHR
ncbi:MAG: MFS transporter, partial [Acidimicrobiia bacterium]|nr:MFS transporter [Acidimicrobiia bacterium]